MNLGKDGGGVRREVNCLRRMRLNVDEWQEPWLNEEIEVKLTFVVVITRAPRAEHTPRAYELFPSPSVSEVFKFILYETIDPHIRAFCKGIEVRSVISSSQDTIEVNLLLPN